MKNESNKLIASREETRWCAFTRVYRWTRENRTALGGKHTSCEARGVVAESGVENRRKNARCRCMFPCERLRLHLNSIYGGSKGRGDGEGCLSGRAHVEASRARTRTGTVKRDGRVGYRYTGLQVHTGGSVGLTALSGYGTRGTRTLSRRNYRV